MRFFRAVLVACAIGAAIVPPVSAATDLSSEALVAGLKSPDAGVRNNSLTALAREKKDPAAVDYAIEALKDKNWYNRMNAVRLLAEMRSSKAVDPLEAALTDDKWNVREAAAEALGKIGDRHSVEVLLSASKSTFPDVKVRATNVLTLVRFPKALDVLHAALKDESPTVRITAALAIQNTDPSDIAPLVGLLKDSNSALAESAAVFLGRIKDTRAVEPLIDALAEHRASDHGKAAEALAAITGQKLGSDPQPWRDWWSKNKASGTP